MVTKRCLFVLLVWSTSSKAYPLLMIGRLYCGRHVVKLVLFDIALGSNWLRIMNFAYLSPSSKYSKESLCAMSRIFQDMHSQVTRMVYCYIRICPGNTEDTSFSPHAIRKIRALQDPQWQKTFDSLHSYNEAFSLTFKCSAAYSIAAL